MRRLWIWTVIFVVTALSVNAAKHPPTHSFKHPPSKNQRVLKTYGPLGVNQFHGHHKRIRARPYGMYSGEEFIRPKIPPPIPPFINGAANNHIKHLSKPPPHVLHKLPSYGLGYPYKNFNGIRPSKGKFPHRIQNSLHVRPSHVTPITQILPGPQLTPLPQVPQPTQFTSIHQIHQLPQPTQLSSVHQVHQVPQIPLVHQIPQVTQTPQIHQVPKIPKVEQVQQVVHVTPVPHSPKKKATAAASLYSPTYVGFAQSTFPNRHIITSNGNDGPIREIPAPDLAPKGPSIFESSNHVQSDAFYNPYKETLGASPQTLDIGAFEQSISLDVANAIGHKKPSYEVTEQSNSVSNDQIIETPDGTKVHYAPDPDPSLPVHKVPPTKDPFSAPSNGKQNINNFYIPYLQGQSFGGVASLSQNELYQLMQGYPTVLSQPLVSFQGQSVANVPGFSQGYLQYDTSAGGQLNQFAQNPELHNSIHSSPESYQEQHSLAATHASVVSHVDQQQQQLFYPQQNQYQVFLQNYQPYFKESTLKEAANTENQENDPYEPEASESRKSPTVIRQTEEGNYGTNVQQQDVDDASSGEQKQESQTSAFPVTNLPEVPFYSSLPSQQAAETLASLQAAGSVASNYLNQIREQQERDKNKRGVTESYENVYEQERSQAQQNSSEEESDENLDIRQNRYQKSTSSASVSQYDDTAQDDDDLANLDFKENISNETFGKRIRPK